MHTPVSQCKCCPFSGMTPLTPLLRLDSSGNVMTNMGYEFVLSVRGSVVQDYTLAQAEEKVHAAVVNAIKALMTGEL